ncbi:MAG TPA: hypothetical protein VI488_02260, partial [Candidatus Angelobacter sp.]
KPIPGHCCARVPPHYHGHFLFVYLGSASFGPVITSQLSDPPGPNARPPCRGRPSSAKPSDLLGCSRQCWSSPLLALALGLLLWAGSRSIARDMEHQGRI